MNRAFAVAAKHRLPVNLLGWGIWIKACHISGDTPVWLS
jgi:hypothetical protein